MSGYLTHPNFLDAEKEVTAPLKDFWKAFEIRNASPPVGGPKILGNKVTLFR